MSAPQRRNKIKEILLLNKEPISASSIAAQLFVSRQIIVGDIALLRMGGMEIDATPRGYIIHKEDEGIIHQVVCMHDGKGLEEELNIMVDYGCNVLNVIVDHPIYGKITGDLHIESRYDVQIFIEKVNNTDALPLSVLTEGIHTHTLSCKSLEGYEKAKQVLREKGILISAS